MVRLIKEQSVFKKDEMLYISKSQQLQQLLKILKFDVLYDPILSAGKKSAFLDTNPAIARRLAEVQKLKIAYCVDARKESIDEYNALVEGIINMRVHARELVVYPFLTQYVNENSAARLRKPELSPGSVPGLASSLASNLVPEPSSNIELAEDMRSPR